MVDTDILIDGLHGFGPGLDYIEDAEQHGTLHISITTEMELIIGCRNRRELYRLERFLRRCTILAMTETIAARAVTLYNSIGSVMDCPSPMLSLPPVRLYTAIPSIPKTCVTSR